MSEKILRTEYSEEMQKSYLDYSMSVITSRAIPDARDGLKPVQRRVLYDMSELHLDHDKPHRKSARIVGDTMGKYHPHGDSSIYETLVVLSQDFKKGMALVDGHGNFGSIEGDGAAAMRYTEARLKKFAEEVYLKDLDKTVDFVSNYDEFHSSESQRRLLCGSLPLPPLSARVNVLPPAPLVRPETIRCPDADHPPACSPSLPLGIFHRFFPCKNQFWSLRKYILPSQDHNSGS